MVVEFAKTKQILVFSSDHLLNIFSRLFRSQCREYINSCVALAEADCSVANVGRAREQYKGRL